MFAMTFSNKKTKSPLPAIRLTKNHPTFQRLEIAAREHGNRCALHLAHQSPFNVQPSMLEAARAAGYRLKAKEYGLTGKYVAH